MADPINSIENDKDFQTSDQGFAAFLATKFMFMQAIDTGVPMGHGKYGNKKTFQFLIPADTDMDALRIDYDLGSPNTVVPFKVAFNKLRMIRQSCQRPFNAAGSK